MTHQTTTVSPTSFTVASTPSSLAATSSGSGYSVGAVLPESGTTLTAFEVPGTTGLAVLDGTTLTFRHEGVTLKNGEVVSACFNGLCDSTTTAEYGPVTIVSSSNAYTSYPAYITSTSFGVTLSSGGVSGGNATAYTSTAGGNATASSTVPVLSTSTTVVHGSTKLTTITGGGKKSAGASSVTAIPSAQTHRGPPVGSSASSSASASSAGAAPPAVTLGAGKAMALIGALGGMVAFGL